MLISACKNTISNRYCHGIENKNSGTEIDAAQSVFNSGIPAAGFFAKLKGMTKYSGWV
jgi:hypothetical protein